MRVLALGTSLTGRQSWPGVLGRRLGECTGRAVELTVVALPGGTSSAALGQVDRISELRPDIATLEFATNDADRRRGLGLTRSVRNLTAIIDQLRASNKDVDILLLAMPDPLGWKASLLRPDIDAYQAAHIREARLREVEVVDVRHWSVELAARDRGALMEDGVHPLPAALERLLVPPLQALACPAPARRESSREPGAA